MQWCHLCWPVPFATCAEVGELVNWIVPKLHWQGPRELFGPESLDWVTAMSVVITPVVLVVLLWQAAQSL